MAGTDTRLYFISELSIMFFMSWSQSVGVANPDEDCTYVCLKYTSNPAVMLLDGNDGKKSAGKQILFPR